MAVDIELSRAVQLYVTCEPHGFPHRDAQALAAAVGQLRDVERLRDHLDTLVAEILGMPCGADLWQSTSAAEAAMAARHPELSDAAITALGRFYSYTWK